MHFIHKILYVCIILPVAIQGASGAILPGQPGDADPNRLPINGLESFTLATRDLDDQLDSFLRIWDGGHRRPDIIDIANIAKRQAGGIQVSSKDLQDLLGLIQSIERHLAAIVESGGGTANGTAVPPPSTTVSNSGPISWSLTQPSVPPTATENGPTRPSVSLPTISPFLTSSGAGNSEFLTSAYVTSDITSLPCKTTMTQTFTEFVYEDGSPAVLRVARSIVDVEEDEIGNWGFSGTQDPEQDDWEPWIEFDGTIVEEDGSDAGFTTQDTWDSLGLKRRGPGDIPDKDGAPLVGKEGII